MKARVRRRSSSTSGQVSRSAKRCCVFSPARMPDRRHHLGGFLSTTFEKLREPILSAMDFKVDMDAHKGRLVIRGVTEGRGEPIKNPVAGAEHRERARYPQRLFGYACLDRAGMDDRRASDGDEACQFLRTIRPCQSLSERDRALIHDERRAGGRIAARPRDRAYGARHHHRDSLGGSRLARRRHGDGRHGHDGLSYDPGRKEP